jgi:hypothetical protein
LSAFMQRITPLHSSSRLRHRKFNATFFVSFFPFFTSVQNYNLNVLCNLGMVDLRI